MSQNKMPVYFISHGGGPWPWLDGPMRESHRELEKSLLHLPQELPEKPKALLIISGHWEEAGFSIMSSPKPPMLYDYGGFPEHTYKVQYPAQGSPELAAKVQSLLRAGGISASLDPKRGFDHGTFVPLFGFVSERRYSGGSTLAPIGLRPRNSSESWKRSRKSS